MKVNFLKNESRVNLACTLPSMDQLRLLILLILKERVVIENLIIINILLLVSDLESNYIVVVFGASWCPQELSKISRLYKKWKEQDVEVIFVSLDEYQKIFKSFAGVFPFISICDYQKWESPIVKNYHVFATPTKYLLDDKREFLLRPNSVSQLDSWVDWYLVQGNK